MTQSVQSHNAQVKAFRKLLVEIARNTPHERKHLSKFLDLVASFPSNTVMNEKHQLIRSVQSKVGYFGFNNQKGAWDYNAVKS